MWWVGDVCSGLLSLCLPEPSISLSGKRYKLIRLLGEGGFSFVYLVQDSSGELYALKKIRCASGDVSNAMREVDAYRAFNHRSLIECVDFGTRQEGDGSTSVYVLLPYYGRGSVQDAINRNLIDGTRFSEEEIIEIFRGVAEGLAEMHSGDSGEEPYVHRDVKPGNILIGEDGHGVLMDFGSVMRGRIRVEGRRDGLAVQDAAAEQCTLAYRAPELFDARRGSEVGDKCDVWSFGASLYAAMHGHSPFEAGGSSVPLAVMNGAWRFPEGDPYGEGIREVVRRCLAVEAASLGWCSFPGAVHDLFAAQASNNSDPCLVDEFSSYSYSQVNAHADALAGRLVAAGVVRGDIVVIFPTRSAAFVVAVVAILKAGAAFCVIDSQYPPERQIALLALATPKAVITLVNLSKEVNFSLDALPLRIVISEFSLRNEPAKSEQVNICVGPDSICSLSFTSGSEGQPKGVLGRHASLTHHTPWMAAKFNLGKSSRFTMLSGIAHDPIQRDIFTPLVLGAQLFIPGDLSDPREISRWMARTGATVTHLTPAMGQLLCMDGVEIPSLRHAFFVGDILTRRDCRALQRLASECTIINMYGSTETQRAVGFFEIPALNSDPSFLDTLPETIPAGKGMNDVQLLVINENKQLCAIGETGEIYVRAPSLAEGYLNLPHLTSQKFVDNWFVEAGVFNGQSHGLFPEQVWFGVRDRMYKTGDLGRYLEDGNVHCAGRADSQVKVRGFRVELFEVDAVLSGHPNILENLTILHQNSLLVSYVKLTTNDHSVIPEVKQFLASKLPSYAVPALIIPLSKFPLTPNGKIDKQRLPKEFSSPSSSHSLFSSSGLRILSIWKSLLLHSEISPHDNFFEIGGHSILAAKLVYALEQEFNLKISLPFIYNNPTIHQTSLQIDSLVPDNSPDYAKDALSLTEFLAESYPPVSIFSHRRNVLLTGSTGFLGVFVLRDLLERENVANVYCIIRGNDPLTRLRNSCVAYGVWNEEWCSRIHVIPGDLALERLGIDIDTWTFLSTEIDTVIHSGATVHWVYPYQLLRNANVKSTLQALSLCSFNKPKTFVFVSSTSVLDTEHYTSKLVVEDDDLCGSETGLNTGYAQSKWVSEYLVREAGERGLTGCIVRPGYITGDSNSGATNTDDFLVRLLKGCIQLGLVPDVDTLLNMVPVNHVARVVAVCAMTPPEDFRIFHITGHPQTPLTLLFTSLESFGYSLRKTDYFSWTKALQDDVFEKSRENALLPLLHFALHSLDSPAPKLDDSYTQSIVGPLPGVTDRELVLYIGFLYSIGYLPPIPGKLPSTLDQSTLDALQIAGGRRR